MHAKMQIRNLFCGEMRLARVLAMAVGSVLMLAQWQSAQAQTLTVLHSFSWVGDGADPEAGVTLDRAGNIYGTTYRGGSSGGCSGYSCGTVFQLRHQGAGWTLNPLYSFGGGDGSYPLAGVVFGPDGALYGNTSAGGDLGCNAPYGCGTVFKLRPSPSACKTALCPWTETVLYAFHPIPDGTNPDSDPIFDRAGNIYGATYYGGLGGQGSGNGAVYELTPSGSGWTESVIYRFLPLNDGQNPSESSMALDDAGNLYGTTYNGGQYCQCGTVFQLTPSGSGWTETIIHSFQYGIDGSFPNGVILDRSGNIYGATGGGGTGGEGTVYELSSSGGGWTSSVLYSLVGYSGCGPYDNLSMDAAGNIYGTTYCGGAYRQGNVFKLTLSGSNWTYTSLYDFTGGADGSKPKSNVTIDASGNLYGTTTHGGTYGYGVVWEITP